MKAIAAKVANRVNEKFASRGRGASVDIPEAPRFGSVLDRPSRPIAAAHIAQARAPQKDVPAIGHAVVQAKAAIADPDTSNADFLEAFEQVAVARRSPRGLAPSEFAMLGDLRNLLANAQVRLRVTRFKAQELVRYQSALKQFGAEDAAQEAGRLRLDHYVRLEGGGIDSARLDASAKEWLAAIDAGHAADLPTECRLIGEMEGFKRNLLEGDTCNWHDFIKLACMIPGVLAEVTSRDRSSLDLHLRILDRVANPPVPANVIDDVLGEITKFQVRAARTRMDGNEQQVNFMFQSTRQNRAEADDPHNIYQRRRVEASGSDPTYRVVATKVNEVTVFLLNSEVDSVNAQGDSDALEDGWITWSADTWQYTPPGEEPPQPVVQPRRPEPEMKKPPEVQEQAREPELAAIEVAEATGLVTFQTQEAELSEAAQAMAEASSVIERSRPGQRRPPTHGEIVDALEAAAQSYLQAKAGTMPGDAGDTRQALLENIEQDMSPNRWVGTMTNKPEWSRFLAALDGLGFADLKDQAEKLARPKK